jgi:hypothetical protein
MYRIEDFDYNATTQAYTLKTSVPNATFISGALRPGSLKIKDINGDGAITTDGDRTIIGHANPKFTGGWNNQFTYKNFDFSMFVNFVYGNDIYNANHIEWTDGSFPNLNVLASVKNRWRNIDDQGNLVTDPAALAKLNPNPGTWTPVNSNRFFVKSSDIEDGSFLRVNNLTLGYSIPTVLKTKIKISQFRVYATVNNIATITHYSGYDPEVTARRTDPLTPGVDFAAYPPFHYMGVRNKCYLLNNLNYYNMKTGYNYKVAIFFLIAIGLTTLGCKKYMEVEPVSQFSIPQVFSDVSNATTALIGVYDELQGDNGYGIRISLYYPYDSDEGIVSGNVDNGRRCRAVPIEFIQLGNS